MADTVAKDVTRYISETVSHLLWGRAAGRCQFSGHNIPLYKSSVTQESVNLAQRAHIYSFSKNGPRGWGPFITNKEEINNIDNLMLMCHGCHKLIDDDSHGEKYSAELLRKWKKEHEERIDLVTGIIPEKKTNVVFYGSNIGNQKSVFSKDDAFYSIFPKRYPLKEHPIHLSMKWKGQDKTEEFWRIEEENLIKEFDDKIRPVIQHNDNKHFSLFALADMPLLVKLGSLFVDIVPVDVYQFLRNPKGWIWQDFPDDFNFIVNYPEEKRYLPVLVLSLSGQIVKERITSILGENVSIWEVTVPTEHRYNDGIRNPDQLIMFIRTIRKLLEQIKASSVPDSPLHIFPAMAVSFAVELGRLRMPKADMSWIIYDQNYEEEKFIKALTIGGIDDNRR